MTGLSHPQPQAMGIGLLHAASLTATIAVVVGGDAQHSPVPRPEPGCVDLPELEKEQR